RTLRKVGGSIMLSLPAELLKDSSLAADDTVIIRSRLGHLDIDSEVKPISPVFAAHVDRIMQRHHKAMSELADR
ncbi:MAG: hypothetical protein ACREP9_20750, partial [Candidatus Dormibacteraceae bacterium]